MKFYEYLQFEKVLNKHRQNPHNFWSFNFQDIVTHNAVEYPLWQIVCENPNTIKKSNEKTTLIITGGVHGLERIGSELCISLLEKYYELSMWDEIFLNKLENLKIVFIPFVNPLGIHFKTRSNMNGVDLMRNSPIDATEKVPFLIGGHYLNNHLPWYRGSKPHSFEKESKFLVREIEELCRNSKFTLVLDIHSGFGFNDQIWFPWACNKKVYEKLDVVSMLTEFFEKLYPYHIYTIEPQSKIYCTHGDLWDYLDLHKLQGHNFIPLTLELGSWIWVKKNPLQLFKLDGLFNPIKKHRIKRTLRRHQMLVDFLMRFLIFTQTENFTKIDKQTYFKKGLSRWYPQHQKIGF